MAFDSLSHFYNVEVSDFPAEWLPLTYLYDPDLPLFPILYIHVLDPDLPPGHRPGERDRLFGFVHHCNLTDSGLDVTVVINKNLTKAHHHKYVSLLQHEIRSRLGLIDPVTLSDLKGCLRGPLANANSLIEELWYKIIDGSFGKSLPFGPNWDPVFGLVRYVASWNSPGGRKGELIQTHGFCSELGERISTGSDVHADFYLLPTFTELTDTSNPLNIFPDFADLVRGADEFVHMFCESRVLGKNTFSDFCPAMTGLGTKLKTEMILGAIDSVSPGYRKALTDAYSSLDRGPQRSIILFMMLHDLRHNLWHPELLDSKANGELYPGLKSSYQSPKVIQLYAQQCFGNVSVLPKDIWVETFYTWPLNFRPSKKKLLYQELFQSCDVWGKLERLIWIAAQARKVHSSVCADILWCVRYGQPKQGNVAGKMRGANPLACKICELHVRESCPGYGRIKNDIVKFNVKDHADDSPDFAVHTSGGENVTKGQSIVSASGQKVADIYSTRDRSSTFGLFPTPGHSGEDISVAEFIERY